MTEKIARRGVFTPDSYEPDILQKMSVAQVMTETDVVLNSGTTVGEVSEWLTKNESHDDFFITVGDDGSYDGILKLTDLYMKNNDGDRLRSVITPANTFLKNDDTLRMAVEEMAKHNCEALPVISAKGNKIVGLLSYQGILTAYKYHLDENETANTQISLKRGRMKMLIKGRKLIRINEVLKKVN